MGGRAVGKSTLGARLAERLGWPFVDLDAELVRLAAERGVVPCAGGAAEAGALLARLGEPAFRRLEVRALCALLRRFGGLGGAARPHVLATGGGTLESNRAARLLAAGYRCAWLRADPEVLRERMRSQPGRRPGLLGDDPLLEVERILARRTPAWREHARWELRADEPLERLVAWLAVRVAAPD